ncbi:NUMOD4 domain-containing protein [Rhodococcus ruber]|uniref:Gp51 n=1 Tax=Rhodococcus ruber TaxID=1830 RepID=A0A098BK34_9NOCA|nr:NUMOD4 domain-containing protein [Rhodococcus ruber]MCZ4533519.1 NUMOD4 domain-containing protein [Rhodococcus ruber]CDZ89063.1 Gp51 [Rhodococcus ruber]
MDHSTIEQWRPVVGAEGCYEVSDHGNVRSLDREVLRARGVWNLKGKPLRPSADTGGYLQVRISYPDGKRTRLVHQLVLESFIGPKPSPDHCGCHNNDIRTDNRAVNLRWDIHDENMKDIVRNGNHFMKNKTHCIRGHEFTPDNIYWKLDKNGDRTARQCKTCTANSSRERYLRNIKVAG